MRALLWTLALAACTAGKDEATDDTDSPVDTTDTPDDTVDTPEDTVDTPEDTVTDTPDDTVDTPDDTVDTPEDTVAPADPTCGPSAAWFTATSGTITDVSAAFSAVDAATSLEWTAPGDGELTLCPGILHGRVAVNGVDLVIRGAGVGVTTLDTRGAGTPFTVTGMGSLTAEDLTVQGGAPAGSGGTAYVGGGASLTLRDLDIDHAIGNCDFYPSCAAAIYGAEGPAAVTIERVNVRDSDGFLTVIGGATALTVTDVTVTNVLVGLGELSAVGTISNLTVDGALSGFGLSGTVQLSVEQSRFSGMGGPNNPAVFFNAGTINSPSSFALTDVEVDGGNLLVCNIWLDNVAFTRLNVHDVNAGTSSAVMVGAPLQITDSTFARITTTGTGAAVYHSGYDAVISGSTFTDNHADSNGGALWLNGWTATISDSTFTGNSSGARGGAIWIPYTAPLTASDCTFEDNSATDGGAIAAENPPGNLASLMSLTRTNFTRNEASNDGGAVWTSRSEVASNLVTLRENTAGRDGGGMRTGFVSSHNLLTAVDNSAGGEGGAIAAANNTSITSSTIYRNTATTAGGVAWWIQLTASNADFGADTDDNLPYDLWDRANSPRSPQSVDGSFTGVCGNTGCPLP